MKKYTVEQKIYDNFTGEAIIREFKDGDTNKHQEFDKYDYFMNVYDSLDEANEDNEGLLKLNEWVKV